MSDVKKGRYFSFVGYPDSLPSDYVTTLNQLGFSWCRSPLHDKDLDPTGLPKKAHYHFIIAYQNPVSFNSIKKLVVDTLNQPMPIVLVSPVGMYRYFCHFDNPDKFQYDSHDIFNSNFNIYDYQSMKSSVEQQLIYDIMDIIKDNHITNYGALIYDLRYKDSAMFDVCMHHTFFFKSLCDSMKYLKK